MKKILIFDYDFLPKECLDKFDTIISWQYLSQESKYDYFEILKFMEENKIIIRNKYLEFIDKVSKYNINGQTLRDLLLIEEKFPFWEMSLINEKSNLKSPYISTILRVIAFEQWFKDKHFQQLFLFTNSTFLPQIISSFCETNGLVFVHKKIKKNRIKYSNNPLNVLGQSLKKHPIFWLFKFILIRLPLLFDNKNEIISLDNQVLFLSYLFNIEKRNINKPYGIDSFWTPLCKKLFSGGEKLNYLSIFTRSNYPNNIFEARNYINIFRKNNHQKSEFNLVDSYLSLKLVTKAIKLFLKVRKITLPLNPTEILTLSSGTDLSSLFIADWYDSFQGRVLMQNSLYCCLFEDISKRICKPSKVFYLLENQNWEFAFIYCFKSIYPNIPIYGYIHSSLRFWDLRYYSKQLNFENKFSLKCYPNLQITNGPQATKLLIESGLSKNNIIELEALRYIHLNPDKAVEYYRRISSDDEKTKVIVIGDYDIENTYKIFQIINNLEPEQKEKIDIRFKPHPANKNKKIFFNGAEVKKLNGKISKYLSNFDLAICGASTTAALDCYLDGIKLIVFRESDSQIMTPVYDLPDVYFMSNSVCLNRILSLIREDHLIKRSPNDFFKIDKNLTKWIEFIND